MAAGAHLVVLDEAECWRLLSGGGVGRVVFDSPRGPTALPVNFGVEQGAIVFRASPGSRLDALAGEDHVGFEVDRIDDAFSVGWSVMTSGRVRHAGQAEMDALRRLGVVPWAAGDRDSYLVLHPTEVTGRRIEAG